MRTVRINASKPYNVYIGEGLLDKCGEIAAEAVPVCRVAVITDSNVAPLYLERVLSSLEKAGFSAVSYIFEAGEKSKNINTLSDILEFAAAGQLTRCDMIAALGGGVCGDLSGFAAGCYLRGIKYIQLPTTLLAAVDSSVGGKTAIDLEAGKNLAGLFLQPECVICDTAVFSTLSDEIFADGVAEALKTGVLSGEKLFSYFENGNVRSNTDSIVAECVAYKGAVVERDELEKGERKLLNLGHTPAHAIEKCSSYGIAHGHAVAAGLAIITRAALKTGRTDVSSACRILKALEKNSLLQTVSFSAATLAVAAVNDKKRESDGITLIIPSKIGACTLEKLPLAELESFFAAGLE